MYCNVSCVLQPPQHLLEANYQRLVREHMKLEKSYAELCGTEGSTQVKIVSK